MIFMVSLSHSLLQPKKTTLLNIIDKMSTQHQAFNNKRDELVVSIQHSVDTIADKCLGKKLITEDTYDEVTQSKEMRSNKARQLLRNISTEIRENSDQFESFLTILKDTSCDTIGEKLFQEWKDLENRRTIKQPEHADSYPDLMSTLRLQESDICRTGEPVESNTSGKPSRLAVGQDGQHGRSVAQGIDPRALIITQQASGASVVGTCLETLKLNPFGMGDVHNFMRRTAYVVSQFGESQTQSGGIWQLSRLAFQDTQDTYSHRRLPSKYERLYETFKIDWLSVTYDDLEKPFYSALAARLYLSNDPKQVPQGLYEQAKYWKFNYMKGAGPHVDYFIERVKILEL